MNRGIEMEEAQHSVPMGLGEAVQVEDARRPIFGLLLIMGAILLIILPFVTTFNEFLTRIVETIGLDHILADWVVPFEARMIAVLLEMIGIPTQVSPSTIYLEKGGLYLPVYISWNCVGWQSFILYAVTLVTGLQGSYTRTSKLEASVLGFLGTFLMNLFRIASVAVVAYHFGHVPAVIYHDYGGTIIILLWLFMFWWFSHRWLLEPLEELPGIHIEERYLKELYSGDSEGGRARRRGWKAVVANLRAWIRSAFHRRKGASREDASPMQSGRRKSIMARAIAAAKLEQEQGSRQRDGGPGP
jgi:exosortase/archaeosortase family protein